MTNAKQKSSIARGSNPDVGIVKGVIDNFSVFKQVIAIRGWVLAEGGSVAALEVRPTNDVPRRFEPEWMPSPDVVQQYGTSASNCRFDAVVQLGPEASRSCGGTLWAILTNGETAEVGVLGRGSPSAAGELFDQFLNTVRTMNAPKVLEIGSRARSGITRKQLLPADTRYMGVDIVNGPNVDKVCDAHALSTALSGAQFDAVMAFSVLEHLLMPWKFVIELNKVLMPGAIGIFTTHQCWPLHDAPWDFWRFSDRAWTALLNPATGFEIISAKMSEPAYVVAADCHPITNFAPVPLGFLASNVLFRKVGTTVLEWPVEMSAITKDFYPA